jgi:hypothetical protein
VLQCGEAAGVGDAAVVEMIAVTQVEVLQCGEAAEVGDAAACNTVTRTQSGAAVC